MSEWRSVLDAADIRALKPIRRREKKLNGSGAVNSASDPRQGDKMLTHGDLNHIMQAAERLSSDDAYWVRSQIGPRLDWEKLNTDRKAVAHFLLSILPKGKRPEPLEDTKPGQKIGLIEDGMSLALSGRVYEDGDGVRRASVDEWEPIAPPIQQLVVYSSQAEAAEEIRHQCLEILRNLPPR